MHHRCRGVELHDGGTLERVPRHEAVAVVDRRVEAAGQAVAATAAARASRATGLASRRGARRWRARPGPRDARPVDRAPPEARLARDVHGQPLVPREGGLRSRGGRPAPRGHDLEACPRERRPASVEPFVEGGEALRQAVELAAPHRHLVEPHLHLVDLALVPHVEGIAEAVPFARQPVREELCLRLPAQRREEGVDPPAVEGRRHDVHLLVDVEEIDRRRPERAPHRGGGPLRNDHLGDPELRREHPRVGRTRPAEREHHEVPGVEALLDRRLVDEVRHLEFDDLGDSRRAGVDVHAEPRRDRADRSPGGGEVEPHRAPREVVGVEASEHEVRVRHRGHVAAPAVADRAGLGPGALRADPEGARHLVDPDHAPAPAPDRLDVHLRQVVLVLVHLAPERVGGLAAVDDPDVERGAAHVGGDDVLVAHGPGRVPRTHHPRDRPRVEGEERRAPRDLDGDGAARGLGDLERGAVSRLFEPPLDVREVARGDRPHVGVEARGGRSFVLAPLGHELVGAGDEEVRGEVPDEVPDPAFVRGLEERPQEADRDRLHVLGNELADGLLGLRLVQGDDDLPEAVHALGDAANEALRYDRARLPALRNVHHLAHFAAVEPARAPHDVDDVVVPAGGDEADPGAPLLDDRVRADGGAVGYERGVREKLPDRPPDLAGRRFERVHEALGEVARRRGRLGAHHPAPVVDDHAVGKRSPDVEAAEILGHGLGCGAPFGIELVRGRLAAPPDSITIPGRPRSLAARSPGHCIEVRP